MTSMRSTPRRFEDLNRSELAGLLREYLLSGHLIDRAGMPHLIGAFGRETMTEVAIEEWMGASPVYTRRMQRALGFEGDTVETIFKGLQLDIGAPPQFMDFRFRLDDDQRGEFWLDHCGALMDVEPMGEEFVVSMCHDIEDPTFDATAIATNPRARIRPIHRPPRMPVDRSPHCHWTVVIADEHEVLPLPHEAETIAATRAAGLDLSTPDPGPDDRDLWCDYRGPLLADLRFDDWSRATLVRVADEVCLQGHLLVLAFAQAVRKRVGSDDERSITREQFVGAAGIAARRIKAALDLGGDLDAAATVLELHPAFRPRDYVDLTVTLDETLLVTVGAESAAHDDGAWPALLDADHLAPLDAIVGEIDRRFRVDLVDQTPGSFTVEVVADDAPRPVADSVTMAAFSTGTDFAFADRGVPVVILPKSP